MAESIRYDHRVSPARSGLLRFASEQPRTPRELRHALKENFESRVRRRYDPDFALEPLNGGPGGNIVLGGFAARGRVSKKLLLARLLDLNGLAPVLKWAGEAPRNALYRRLKLMRPSLTGARSLESWLDSYLLGKSRDEQSRFLRALFALMARFRAKHPFQPAWVTSWIQFEPYLSQPPEVWAEVLGMEKAPGRWLVMLCYEAGRVGTLARPTLLDAGTWNYLHFPSPDHLEARDGGHPMALRSFSRREPLLPEWLHTEIDYRISDWRRAGWAIARLGTGVSGDLLSARRAHHKRLSDTYGPAHIDRWMPSTLY
ncbi:MAG: hypothetical protein U0002_11580 [Thermoanaerobaculia bacterium]